MLKTKCVQSFSEPCVFLLGGFDGLHLGHKKLLDFARSFGLPVGIMTMTGGKGNNLFTLSERRKIFCENDLSFVWELAFDERLKNSTKEEFADRLTSRFCVRSFVCGKDFRFGKGAEGTPQFIEKYTGVPTYSMELYEVGDEKLGMQRVKNLLQNGKIGQANALLVQHFFLSAQVREGRKTGRTLGFPTANLVYPAEKHPLREGVYAVHAYLAGERYAGICNFGGCPTFGIGARNTEVYFDGFSGDLYGQTVEVYFDGFLRETSDYGSPENLCAQLKKDLAQMRVGAFDK